MAISVTFRGTTYAIPSPGDSEWATSLNAYLQAIAGAFSAVKTTLTGSTTVAPLKLTPQSNAPSGPNAVGDLYVTTAGVLKVCTVAGSPGTFVSVGGQS